VGSAVDLVWTSDVVRKNNVETLHGTVFMVFHEELTQVGKKVVIMVSTTFPNLHSVVHTLGSPPRLTPWSLAHRTLPTARIQKDLLMHHVLHSIYGLLLLQLNKPLDLITCKFYCSCQLSNVPHVGSCIPISCLN
jgi:hypothetical protein